MKVLWPRSAWLCGDRRSASRCFGPRRENCMTPSTLRPAGDRSRTVHLHRTIELEGRAVAPPSWRGSRSVPKRGGPAEHVDHIQPIARGGIRPRDLASALRRLQPPQRATAEALPLLPQAMTPVSPDSRRPGKRTPTGPASTARRPWTRAPSSARRRRCPCRARRASAPSRRPCRTGPGASLTAISLAVYRDATPPARQPRFCFEHKKQPTAAPSHHCMRLGGGAAGRGAPLTPGISQWSTD